MDWNLNNWLVITILVSCTALGCAFYVFAWSHRALGDEANDRSLHQGKTLTAGGVFILLPWLVFTTWKNPELLPLYGVWLMMLVGLADDVWHWSAKPKLIAQLLVTLLLLYHFSAFSPWFWTAFLLLAVIWWLNLFNFMDGANGIAGLHAVVVLVFYLILLGAQDTNMSLMLLVLLFSLLVFLVFNLILGRLFMGDSGSLPLAFIQAWLALYGLSESVVTLPLVALLHASFVADATYTLMVRTRKGERLSEAHSTHFYQRWVKTGMSHAKVSWAYTTVTTLCAAACLALLNTTLWVQWSVTMVVYLFMAMFFIKTLQLSR